MKLLTSSSSSYSPTPSSSSTLSLDPTLCNSKSVTAGCLTAILRRILCSGGLPTHPSDQIRELDSMSKMSGKVQELKTKQNTESTTTITSSTTTTTTTTTTITRGIVERLMGLESMVDRDTNTTNEATSSSSLPRSKSMNSVDYLGECKRMEGLHKRAKSSSFREVPTFHLHENENFLVLSFESGCDGGEFRPKKGIKKEKGSKERSELKKNKREKVHDEKEKGNLSDISSANVGKHRLEFANTSALFMACSEKEYVGSETERFSHPVKRKEVANGEKVKTRKKGTTCYAEKKVDTECSSEDSSPVSIFDFEREAPGTEVDSFGVDTSWRRKLSPELENEQLDNLMIEEMKVNTIEDNKHEESKKNEKQSQEGVDIWGEICRLVEGELGSNKLKEGLWKQDDIESVCAGFGSQIFDHLLYELIDQLVGNPLKALQLQNL